MEMDSKQGRFAYRHGGRSGHDGRHAPRGGEPEKGRRGGAVRAKGLGTMAERLAAKLGDRHGFGRGSGRGHGGGSGGGMRRQRMFDGGELRLVLLKLIADEPRHGYELIKSIEDMTGGGYAPSPGIVYPTLTMLNELGHVASEDTGNGRKKFTITPEGRAHLSEHAVAADKLVAKLAAMGEEHKRTDGAPVRRAMANLKVALQGRLSRADSTDAVLLDVAALIDEAAQKIERLS